MDGSQEKLLSVFCNSSPKEVGGPELVENYTVPFRKPLASGRGHFSTEDLEIKMIILINYHLLLLFFFLLLIVVKVKWLLCAGYHARHGFLKLPNLILLSNSMKYITIIFPLQMRKLTRFVPHPWSQRQWVISLLHKLSLTFLLSQVRPLNYFKFIMWIYLCTRFLRSLGPGIW